MTSPKFDFKKAREAAVKMSKLNKLQVILLGHSGSGKSYALGTLGCRTLYLYGTKEAHGPQSARNEGGDNIVPMCMDYGTWPGEDDKRAFTGDESYEFICSLLSDIDHIKSEKVGAVVIDSLSVLEAIVKDTSKWADKCKTTAGKHNTFKESEASQEMLGAIIDKLKYIQQELDVHVVVTGIIDVKDKDGFGAVVEAVPRLGGYGLCENMIQHFADVVVTGKMTKNGEVKYKFQFMTDLTKAAKDEHGNVKKAMNFSPRLTGCTPPSSMDANLAELAKLKAARK
jgi:hypothetical protein